MDLGTKRPEGDSISAPSSPDRPKVSYPGFSLNDALVPKFLKECDCTLGDEITATVKLKVTSLSDESYGKRIGFDVLALDDAKPGEEEPKEDDEEKVLGYKREKVAPKNETPDTSAKSLLD